MKLPVNYESLSFPRKREVREEYIRLQEGLCFWCGESLREPPPSRITDQPIDWGRFPPNFLKHPVHLQHDHTSGLTEGAVHSYCNAVMWQYHGR